MPRCPLALVFAIALLPSFRAQALRAQDDAERARGFVERSIALDSGPLAGRRIRYRLHVPEDARPGERLPVVLFLHGAGERGDDNLAQLRHFPERMVRGDYRALFRTILVAPQCPRGSMWIEVDWSSRAPQTGPSPWLAAARAALTRTLAEERADPDRVYLTGLSMGGYGAWHLAADQPETFAAVVPVCGGGDPAQADALRELPIWAWHGAEDHVVPAVQTRRMVDAVRSAGGLAHYTELPFTAHDSWTAAYDLDRGALRWMFAQRRDEPALGRVIACEQQGDRLLMLDLQRAWDDPLAVLWQWSPDDVELPEEQRAWFDDPSDAKPILRGQQLIGTAAGGAVFQLRLADGELLFHSFAGANPHSVTRLPDGSLVVASSNDDRLARFAVPAPVAAPPLQELILPDAHGVHWDADGELLWALGGAELVGYALRDDELVERHRAALPAGDSAQPPHEAGGHDLAPWRGAALLLVSDRAHLWTFDPSELRFEPFAALPAAADVKSITTLRRGGPFLVLRADAEANDAGDAWWSDTGRLVGLEETAPVGDTAEASPRTWTFPEARFYKLRAWP